MNLLEPDKSMTLLELDKSYDIFLNGISILPNFQDVV